MNCSYILGKIWNGGSLCGYLKIRRGWIKLGVSGKLCCIIYWFLFFDYCLFRGYCLNGLWCCWKEFCFNMEGWERYESEEVLDGYWFFI